MAPATGRRGCPHQYQASGTEQGGASDWQRSYRAERLSPQAGRALGAGEVRGPAWRPPVHPAERGPRAGRTTQLTGGETESGAGAQRLDRPGRRRLRAGPVELV